MCSSPRLYAWGEVHVLVGMLIFVGCDENLVWALPLAVLSHWCLDDLNVGHTAMVYHGIGRGWRAVVSSLLRVPLWGFILWQFWSHPAYLACGLAAWLVLDHEWLVGALIGRHGYGLHERMWPKRFHSEWGLLPWAVVIVLLCLARLW